MKVALFTFLLGLVACGDPGNGPAPAPPVTPEAHTHTLELSYWLASYGDASQLPATAPLITVVLRPVLPGPSGFANYQPEQTLLRLQDVSTDVKKVKLPDLTTYAPGQTTLLLATVTVPAVPGMGPGLGYYV
ncbi:hypothetical protein ACFQT0_30050 [Hymenobacter humi]|uniref:Lipoprotein n=1 Tax=Hymenobacter humi TaxID=1411620 RepID=A0ABW2UFF4_9BACT